MADTSPRLQQSVRWGERYVSSALNRKFAGILKVGVYHGFVVGPAGGGLQVRVDNEPEYPFSVAVVERGPWSITVTMSDGGIVEIPGAGTWYVVIEAMYSEQEPGYQRIVARQTVESHHVIIATVTVAEGQTEITSADISYADNTVQNAEILQELAKFTQAIESLNTWDAFNVEIDASNQVHTDHIFTLPDGKEYRPGCHQLFVSWNGLECYEGLQYEEVAEDGAETANAVRFLFHVFPGSELRFVNRGFADMQVSGIISDYNEVLGQITELRTALERLSASIAYIGQETTSE